MKLNKKRSWVLLLSTITMLSITGCGGDGENGGSSNNNLLYELHLPIFHSGQPVDPTNPTNPIYPEDPIAPTNPTEPTEPSNPVVPPTVETIDPSNPIVPPTVEPTNPNNPIVPPTVEPTNPNNPVVPPTVEPTNPNNPVVPPTVEPTNPNNPVVPPTVEPIDPSNPVVPPTVEPTNPSNPIVPPTVEPIDPPIEPSQDNLPPVAIGSVTPASIVVDPDFSHRITLDGSASYDQDTLIEPITHIWTSGSIEVNNVMAEAFVSCSNKYEGCANNICTYTAYLEVSDGELTDNDQVSINVDYNACIAEVLPPEPLSCDELIGDKPDSIYITNNPERVAVTENVQLHLWGVYAEGTICEITHEPASVWSSHDKKIASADSKGGIVTGVSVGSVTIEAKHRSDGAGDSSVTSTVEVFE